MRDVQRKKYEVKIEDYPSFYELEAEMHGMKLTQSRSVDENPYDKGSHLWMVWNMGFMGYFDMAYCLSE